MSNDEIIKEILEKMLRDDERHKGACDCQKGIPPKSNSPDYLIGYSNQYAFEQQQSQGEFN